MRKQIAAVLLMSPVDVEFCGFISSTVALHTWSAELVNTGEMKMSFKIKSKYGRFWKWTKRFFAVSSCGKFTKTEKGIILPTAFADEILRNEQMPEMFSPFIESRIRMSGLR
ncbi:MAG TPA: hypothetical protein VF571_19040 [Pyrinomonadaceae bacterium]|jgi:hypothetical protein